MSAAGSTRLPRAVQIRRVQLALEHRAQEEVADSRDFLLGANEGGAWFGEERLLEELCRFHAERLSGTRATAEK